MWFPFQQRTKEALIGWSLDRSFAATVRPLYEINDDVGKVYVYDVTSGTEDHD
jgi:hypothetical protein